jgi:hypothetical protein
MACALGTRPWRAQTRSLLVNRVSMLPLVALEFLRGRFSTQPPMCFGNLMNDDFHCLSGNLQVLEDLSDALDDRFGLVRPKTFPHVNMNDWHVSPP